MGTNEFQKVYLPGTVLVKEENGDLLADPHRILNRWTNSVSYWMFMMLMMLDTNAYSW